MTICAAADIHYPRIDFHHCQAIAERMCESGADVLLLAGDVASGDEKHYRKILQLFECFHGPKLFVPGNHDLWSISRHSNTASRYRRTLRHIVERYGFHYLPNSPIIVGEVGFAGTVGWHDYTFRQSIPPQPELHVTPLRAFRGRNGPVMEPLVGRKDLPWEELTEDDYAGQALEWCEAGQLKRMLWNDAVHVNWGASDQQVAEMLANELRCDLIGIAKEAAHLVAVTHFVPFEGLLGATTDNVETAYVRAFAGSWRLGEAVASVPGCRLVLCGHWHHQKLIEAGDLVVANCSVGDGNSGPLLLTLPK
ncbi:MAG: metallophosphoesterase [Candidatus Zipacnadales bacterium]